MTTLSETLLSKPVIFITRDIERALGLSFGIAGYYSIANSTPFAKSVTDHFNNVLLIESDGMQDTRELLLRSETAEFIKKIPSPNILVFKNTGSIEKICAKRNWNLLNPPAKLAATVEEKISQVIWLGELSKFLPQHEIKTLKDVFFDEKKFIVQFNRSHTGMGTTLIDNEKILNDLRMKFPDRPARVTQFIAGPIFTLNAVCSGSGVLVSNPSYQITGLTPFTDQPFATVGNDWSLAKKMLSDNAAMQLKTMAKKIGEKMYHDGWRGLFGIDAVLDEAKDIFYLIEINARQPASAAFESRLQYEQRSNKKENEGEKQKKPLTTFEAHLLSLMNKSLENCELIQVDDGSQIIMRNKADNAEYEGKIKIKIKSKLESLGFYVVPYENTKQGSDHMRIQSRHGIMSGHNEFNEIGKKIYDTLIA